MIPLSPSFLPPTAPSQSPWLVSPHFPELSTLRAQSLHLCSCLNELIQSHALHVVYVFLIPTGLALPKSHCSSSPQKLVSPPQTSLSQQMALPSY